MMTSRIKSLWLGLATSLMLVGLIATDAQARPFPALELQTPTGLHYIEKGDPIYYIAHEVTIVTVAGRVGCPTTFNSVLETNGQKRDLADDFELNWCGTPVPGKPKKAFLGAGSADFEEVGIELSAQDGATCSYSAKKMKGTFDNAPDTPIVVSMDNQTLKATKGSPKECGKSVSISADWNLTGSLPGSAEQYPVVLGS